MQCAPVCLLECWGFPLHSNLLKRVTRSVHWAWLLFPPHSLWSAVVAKVLTARSLRMPFSNTLFSSGLFVVKTTLHLLRLLFLHFPRVRRLWKKLKITSWKMWSLWWQNYQLILSPGDEPGYTAKRKTNPPKWGKGRRIIMYPNQKFK